MTKTEKGGAKGAARPRKSPEELLKERIVKALSSIAFTTDGDYGGLEIKLKDSLKAMELLCKLSGLLSGEKPEDAAGQLRELMEGLEGNAAHTGAEEEGEEDV